MQDKRALQGGTSHFLGQNFAKAFDVQFQDENGDQKYVYATSWGVSTRLVGALIMTHSDDKGLVIPPRLAPIKVVIIPIWREESQVESIKQVVGDLTRDWNGRISYKVDDRDQYRPGYKFNEWEKRGVPLRVEIGPKDIEHNQVVLARRDNGEKTTVSQEGLLEHIETVLESMQHDLFERARSFRDANTFKEDNYQAFQKRIEDPGGFYWVHWCGDSSCEAAFQETSKATIRLIPTDGNKEQGSCIVCGKPSPTRVLVAKSY